MITRREFFCSSLAVAGPLTSIYSWRIEPRWVEMSHRDLILAHLPADLDGRLPMQTNDMHLSDRYER